MNPALWLLAMVSLPSAQGAVPDDCTATAGLLGALEIINMFNCTVYIADNEGRPDVSDEAFENWVDVKNNWQKNPSGVRYTTMQRDCLYASPGYAAQHVHLIDAGEPWSPPVSWAYLAQSCAFETVMGGCFPSACVDGNAVDGSLKFYEINKCHKMVWDKGTKVSIITDPDGNKYIMHSSSSAQAAADGIAHNSPELPDGWVRQDNHTLEDDIVYTPFTEDSSTATPVAGAREPFGSLPCGSALIQDSQGNAYHRYNRTTGNANIKGKLHLLFDGKTPAELMAEKKQEMQRNIIIGIVVGVSLLVVCVGVFCAVRSRAQGPQDEQGPGMELVS